MRDTTLPTHREANNSATTYLRVRYLTIVEFSEAVGWASSAILLVTLFTQVRKQWKSGESKGVSIWLFIGQMAASIGFAAYSWMVGNSVFVFTNTLMVFNGLAGYLILRRNQRRQSEGA